MKIEFDFAPKKITMYMIVFYSVCLCGGIGELVLIKGEGGPIKLFGFGIPFTAPNDDGGLVRAGRIFTFCRCAKTAGCTKFPWPSVVVRRGCTCAGGETG